jgi:hypothetical protein
MDRRDHNKILGLAVQTAITSAGLTPETLSKATDLPVDQLEAHLQGAPFKLADLAKVGGFLSSRPSVLTEGMHA